MSSNTSITAEIRSRYDADPRILYPAEIALEERDGTVTLRGTVGDFRQRHAAAKIAGEVRGVRRVEDDLTVDLRDHWDDEQLRGAALQALIDDDDVPADQIDATVSSAWLTLSGEVKHQSQSNAAFEAVAGLPGMGGITNKIRVVAPAGR
jgi:osmotically-inducible protein OsmY